MLEAAQEAAVATIPSQLLAAFVPFANPMADEKAKKKVLKSVKKGALYITSS